MIGHVTYITLTWLFWSGSIHRYTDVHFHCVS